MPDPAYRKVKSELPLGYQLGMAVSHSRLRLLRTVRQNR